MPDIDPKEYIITRKRKKYKFAVFANSPLCFEFDELPENSSFDVLEIGAGTGQFSVALAIKYPEKIFLAADVKADRLQVGARDAQEKGLDNIIFLRARAEQLVESSFRGSFDSIWITFPDPFPKMRSCKHRLTHPKYLKIYQALLKQEGSLYLKTDAKVFFEWSLEQLVQSKWAIQELSFDLHESNLASEYKIQTVYESRFKIEGAAINFVRIQKL